MGAGPVRVFNGAQHIGLFVCLVAGLQSKMSKCKNCGHDSHCGVTLKKEMGDGDNKVIEVEVCKQCRCYNCSTKTDWG